MEVPEILQIFRHLDRNNKGYITVDQLVLDMYQSHADFHATPPVKPLELKAVIFKLLGHKTNEIRELEFIQLVQQVLRISTDGSIGQLDHQRHQ